MVEGKNISEFFDKLLFLNIFKIFRIAIQPSKVLTAFLAVIALFVLGWIMDSHKTVVTPGRFSESDYSTELHCFLNDNKETQTYIEDYQKDRKFAGVGSVFWNFCAGQFNEAVINILRFNFIGTLGNMSACVSAVMWALIYHTIYSIIFLSAAMVVLSIAGGAICRGAALQFARDERPGFIESLRFSMRNFKYFFISAFAPAGVLIFFSISVFIFGILFNIPFAGNLILGICAAFLVLVGLMSAIVILGTISGGHLMFPVIAYENSDNYEAVSRAFSYICIRPWRMAGYAIAASVYGAICYLFVRFLVFLSLDIGRKIVAFSIWTDSAKTDGLSKIEVMWPRPEFFNLLGNSLEASRNFTESVAALLIYLAILIAAGVVLSFLISFYFSASTVIYALMRKHIDHTPLDDIYVRIEQLQQEQPE